MKLFTPAIAMIVCLFLSADMMAQGAWVEDPGNQRVTLDPAYEKVGIGKNAPSGILHIKSTANKLQLSMESTGTDNPDLSLLHENKTRGQVKYLIAQDGLGLFADANHTTPGGLNTDFLGLFVRGTDRHVGIGTIDPLCRLHIVDNEIESSLALGMTPNGIFSKFRTFCDPAAQSDIAFSDINLTFDPTTGQVGPTNPDFGTACTAMSVGPEIPAPPDFQVDSFFDIEYRIDFTAPPGTPFELQPRLNIQPTGFVGLGTDRPIADLHINGVNVDPATGNANPVVAWGPWQFPGCRGYMGRFCRRDPLTGLPDGRYDLVRYMNAQWNEFDGTFTQNNPDFDAWMDGPCIADDPTKSGWGIGYAPHGTTGQIDWISRLFIDADGQVGICSSQPMATLDVQNDFNPNNTSFKLATTPNNISRCVRVWCPGLSDYRWEYMNAQFDGAGNFFPTNPNFGSLRTQICVGPPGVGATNSFDIEGAQPGTGGGPILWQRYMHINDLGNTELGPAPALPGARLAVDGIVTAVDFIPTSDARFKTNIATLESSLDKIRQLRGVSYDYDQEGKFDFPARSQMGFIAQEIKEVYPELVHEADNGYNGVNYMGLIPALVESVKELDQRQQAATIAGDPELKADVLESMQAMQQSNEQLRADNIRLQTELDAVKTEMAEIKDLIKRFDGDLDACCTTSGSSKTERFENAGMNESAARLEQNNPNPFNESTLINYYLPENAKDAQIHISTLDGKLLKVLKVDNTGNGQAGISAGELAPGNYIYTLQIEGKTIDSKQMTVTH